MVLDLVDTQKEMEDIARPERNDYLSASTPHYGPTNFSKKKNFNNV